MCSLHTFQFYLFCTCVHIFTLFTYLVYYTDLLSATYFRDLQPEYDYVIVGAGTAGSLIAHRLATETNYTFVALEAGSKGHALLEAPVLGPFLHRSLFDWQFETVPQENACLAMKNKQCRLAQGKVIGGSSKLNNMVHIRGNITHYINWFHGKYTERYIEQQFEFIEKEILHLDYIKYESELSDTVLRAAREIGFQNCDLDFKLGFSKSIVSQKNGKRWSTSDNLDISKHVISNALVESILFNGNTAVAVKVSHPKGKTKIHAKKGIVLTAGAINTPKILQLSGIGPENLLKSLNIPSVKNLPVGKNLQDHIGSGLDLVLFNKSLSISPLQMINPYHVFNYLFYGSGPWTMPGCEVVGLLLNRKNLEQNVELMVLPVGLSSDKGSILKHSIGLNEKVWDKYFSRNFDKYVATFLSLISHPKSVGYVFINSTDPNEPPLIDPKYLSHTDDRKALIQGLKFVKKLIETDAIKNVGGYINPNHFPGCEHFEIFTDSYFDCYIRHLTLTSYHPVGTCSMGLPDSKNAVVDTSFKVLGVNRLYVADASVLPTIPSVNINAAVAMMANVFFNENINSKDSISFCFKEDRLNEYLFNICIKC